MIARLSAFVIWALVAAGMVFWGLRLFVKPEPAPLNAVVVGGDAGGARNDLTRLLGAEPVAVVAAAPAMSTRFKLLGVMAAKAPADAKGPTPGIALISIDGKPPRPYVAGARVDEQLVLQTVSMRSATLGPAEGAPSFTLEVPPFPQPSTGTPTKAVMDPVPPVGQAVPQAPPPGFPAPTAQTPQQAQIPVPGANEAQQGVAATGVASAPTARIPRRPRPGAETR